MQAFVSWLLTESLTVVVFTGDVISNPDMKNRIKEKSLKIGSVAFLLEYIPVDNVYEKGRIAVHNILYSLRRFGAIQSIPDTDVKMEDSSPHHKFYHLL